MVYRSPKRRGATVLECAIVFPAFFLVLIGMIVMGVGVFHYHEVAHLAREGARYASVRGDRYSKMTGYPAATVKDVFENGIKPKVVGLDVNRLTYDITWDPNNEQESFVIVTLRYQWIPVIFFNDIELTSTSKVPVSF